MGTTHDNYNDVMRARLRSRKFTMRFLDHHNIYRFFYPEHWSEEKKEWLNGFSPDRGAVFTRFRDEVREIRVDEETDIITVAPAAEGVEVGYRAVFELSGIMRLAEPFLKGTFNRLGTDAVGGLKRVLSA